MPSGDLTVSVIAGGQLEKLDNINNIQSVNQIDLIKKIQYPEALVPDVDMPGTKGFRINITSDEVSDTPVTHSFDMDVYLSSINVTCETYDDLDYWELSIGTDKLCESIYTLDVPVDSNSGVGFQIFPKITSGTVVTFNFHNGSAIPKKVWVTLGYMYKIV